MLILEINQNQETCDADRLTRNVSLIWELNTNTARVVEVYSELSRRYAHVIAAKKATAATGDKAHSSGAGQQQ